MTKTPSPPEPAPSRARALATRAVRLTGREYLPMVLTIAFWAVAALVVGHADAARLVATTVLLRGVQMLVQMNSAAPLQLRRGAARAMRIASRRTARWIQAGSFACAVVLVILATIGLRAAGQWQMAAMLPLAALCLPARAVRFSDYKTASPHYRFALSASGLVGAGAAWLAGADILGMALAYGAREWIALIAVRMWPKPPRRRDPVEQPLTFREVARSTAVSGRRMLTYRLTKNILTVFGPFGNFAARTGRGMGWHNRIEPFLPHKLAGFVLFALGTAAAAVVLALRSGEPVAMIGAAGLLQLSAVATNVALMWHWLPDRDDPDLVVEDDDDE